MLVTDANPQQPDDTTPPEPETLPPRPDVLDHPPAVERLGSSADETLEQIRHKMESVAAEFGEGKINRVQFDALYSHYSEQRVIIERLIERNPNTDAWRQVARPGHTEFLRSYFEARAEYYMVFRHRRREPIATGGEQPPGTTPAIVRALKDLWNRDSIPDSGLARLEIDETRWLVMANGPLAATIVIFSLQPSQAQTYIVRDLHEDFERANRLSLQRGLPAQMMVFPQRSLLHH